MKKITLLTIIALIFTAGFSLPTLAIDKKLTPSKLGPKIKVGTTTSMPVVVQFNAGSCNENSLSAQSFESCCESDSRPGCISTSPQTVVIDGETFCRMNCSCFTLDAAGEPVTDSATENVVVNECGGGAY